MTARFWTSATRRFQASLRLRVLVLTLAAFVAVAVPAAGIFVWLVDRTVETLGTMFAERQVLYDRYRGLEALRREVALAETLMRSPVIVDWSLDEQERDKFARGIAELEHFRRTFVDRSYFFVVGASGNYYFNDHNGQYTGSQLRYTLSPSKPDDDWYYKTVAKGAGCHLNVNHDTHLGVTKVWINCVVSHDGAVTGLVGTGIELTSFLRNVVESDLPGVETIFIDGSGAVQANRDESLVDFRSLTKDDSSKKTFFQLLANEDDRATFARMLQTAKQGGEETATTATLEVDGRNMLVGVGHLAELGWFNVTVMDVDKVVDRRLFGPLAVLIGLVIVSAAMLVTLLFKRSVLDRLAHVERSVHHIEAGDFSGVRDDGSKDEIGRLARAINRMAGAIGFDKARLEAAVRERTEQLERIAYIDQLSGVLNRRGFIEAFQQLERRRPAGDGKPGLLILDIDNFKQINDAHGHVCGDEVIAEVARRLLDVTREQDLCARWGGDEFVIILKDCDRAALKAVGAKVLEAVGAQEVNLSSGGRVKVATSIGAHLVEATDTLESSASKADLALYEAKRLGRNRMMIYDPATHGNLVGIGYVA